jgi:hypothetical protein
MDNQEAVYYENKEGFGLFFPSGMDPQVLIDQINKLKYESDR